MITLLSGENTYEKSQMLRRIQHDFDGTSEVVDGSEVTTDQLPDLLMGVTLFSSRRLVILKELASNKTVWNDLTDWLPRISDDIHVVFVESKPDKRTKTYKELVKIAEVKEFPVWTDRDETKAESWMQSESARRNITLDQSSARLLVRRIGVDQWALSSALEKLSTLDVVTIGDIEQYTDANPVENVFNIFEAALSGDRRRITDMIKTLELTDDPYMVFGLLSGQVFQLAALTSDDVPQADIAKAIGAHPFALQKLASHARKRGVRGTRMVTRVFAEADVAMKTTAADPWLLIERALLKIALH